MLEFDRLYEWEASVRRVSAGAKFLDEVAPGWERKVDLSILDIADGYKCICGQVFMQEALEDVAKFQTGYGYALETFTQSEHGFWPVALGFIISADGDAWAALIKQRFDTGTLSDGEV